MLLGLVFVHLIPEAAALSGMTWELTSLIVAGYLIGMLTEHGLYILGFEHQHSGHTSHTFHNEQELLTQEGHTHLHSQHTQGSHPAGNSAQHAHGVIAYALHTQPAGPNTSNTPFPPQAPIMVLNATEVQHSGASVNMHSNSIQSYHKSESESNAALEEGGTRERNCCTRMLSPIIINILVGDAFHNIFDGVAIASAFSSCSGMYVRVYVCMYVCMYVYV
jgi:zinc transporter ZupT